MKLVRLGAIAVLGFLIVLLPGKVLGATGTGFYRARVLFDHPLSARWVNLEGISGKSQRYLLEYVRGQQPVKTRDAELAARLRDGKILRVEYCKAQGQCTKLQGLYAGRAPF